MSVDLSNKLGGIVLIAFLIVCFGFSVCVKAHKFHTSLTSIEYNAEEELAQITVQIFTEDLEEILGRRNKKRVTIGKDAETMVFAYLQEMLLIKNNKGEPKELSYIGMEQKADAVWIYVETKMPEGLYGASIRNKLLFDLLSDQVNLVNLKFDEKTTSLAFKPGDGFKTVHGKKK